MGRGSSTSSDVTCTSGAALVYHTAAGVVVRPPGVEDVFMGVRFEAASLPWRSDVERPPATAAALGSRVRCDPGLDFPGLHPLADVFLEVAVGTAADLASSHR
jgi:hypothetical protein